MPVSAHPKKLLMVWTADYPWDVRVEKTTTSLIHAGYEVHLLCRNLNRAADTEVINGLVVHRLPNLPRFLDKANGLFTMPAFFNPVWSRHLEKLVKRHGIDMIIVRDLPMCLAGIKVARRCGIPCVLDMAEVYPAMWSVMARDARWNLGRFLLKNPRFAQWMEVKSAQSFDGVWVMVEESKDRLIALGVKPELITIVSNTPVLEKFTYPAVAGRDNNPLKIVYTGIVSEMRGLDTVIKAIKILKDRGVEAKLIIAGQGGYLEELKKLCAQLGVESQVDMLGWVEHAKLPGIIADCSVGVVPHRVNEHTNTTVPNKIFDYMALGLPVLVSDVKPLKRVVEESGCGLAYRDLDEFDLAEKLVELDDPGRRSGMGQNAKKSVVEKYNWQLDCERMLASVSGLV